jgi:hypothetical protein
VAADVGICTAEKLVLNRWQMHIAGLLEQVEVKV